MKKHKYMYFLSIVQPDPDSFDINNPLTINEHECRSISICLSGGMYYQLHIRRSVTD